MDTQFLLMQPRVRRERKLGSFCHQEVSINYILRALAWGESWAIDRRMRGFWMQYVRLESLDIATILHIFAFASVFLLVSRRNESYILAFIHNPQNIYHFHFKPSCSFNFSSITLRVLVCGCSIRNSIVRHYPLSIIE